MNRYTTVLPKNVDRVLLSRKPAIMILSSGMLVEETLSYLFASHMVKSERDSIIFMGYQSPDSPGFHLLKAFKEGKETFLFDQEEVELRCRAIENMNFSGHATYEELLSIPRQLGSSRLVLVHGDSNALENIAHEVMYEFDVDIPSNLEEVVF
jgi:predicted metal-dependent RNase